jgi:hypothetical protein
LTLELHTRIVAHLQGNESLVYQAIAPTILIRPAPIEGAIRVPLAVLRFCGTGGPRPCAARTANRVIVAPCFGCQILDHASVQTTERYLGYKQNLGYPANDLFCLGAGAHRYEPNPQPAVSESLETMPRQELECPDGGFEPDDRD